MFASGLGKEKTMNAHQIQNGIVVNTIVVDSLDVLPDLIEATHGGIGWLWDGETLTAPPAPPVPIPQQVTMRQARLALLGAGLLAGVDAAIDSLPEPDRTAAKIDWEYAAVVQRDSGLVPAMGAALGMTEAQIDALFVEAARL